MTDPVYLDHAATTPMVPEALEAMVEQLGRAANPSSLHASGRAARRAVEEARERVAAALGCRPGEVVFTSGGTEADNLALKGLAWARRDGDPRRTRLLTTAVEHHAVLDPLEWLEERQGFAVEHLAVDAAGRLDPAALDGALAEPSGVGLVSVMWANNEVGTLQPLDRVVASASERGIPVHTGLLRCRLVDEPHVGPAPVGLGASPLHDPGALEHREVVGEQVGAQAEPLGDLARRGVLGGEEVDDSQSRHVRERGVPRGAGLEAAHNQ